MARDYKRIVSNVEKLLKAGEPDTEIRSYLSYEGLTVPQFQELLQGPTILGQAREAIKGVPAGAVNLLESAGVGLAAALPDEYEQQARRFVQETGAAMRRPFEARPGYEETIPRKGGEALGSTAPFFALGPVGAVGRVGAGALAAGAGAGEARLRAEEAGATPEQRRLATGFGTAIGATEMLPVFAFLDSLSTPIKQGIVNKVQRALVTGGAEAAQEAAAAAAQNLVAQKLYKPDQALIEGVGEEAAYGGAVGALIQGITDMALGRKGMRTVTEAGKKAVPEEEKPVAEAAAAVEPITEPDLFARSYERVTLEIEKLKQQEQTDEVKAQIKELEGLKKDLLVDSARRAIAKPVEDIAEARGAGAAIEPAAGLRPEDLAIEGTQGEFRETLGLPTDFAVAEEAEKDQARATFEDTKSKLDGVKETLKLLKEDKTLPEEQRKALIAQANKAQRQLSADLKAQGAALGEVDLFTEEEFSTVLTRDMLENIGLKPQSGFFKELIDKDMANEKDAAAVADVLKRVRSNPRLSDSTKEGIEGVAMQAFNALATQQELKFEEKKAKKAPVKEEVVEEPVQEELAIEPEVTDVERRDETFAGALEPSVSVSGEGVAPTPRAAQPEPRGLVPSVSPARQPAQREEPVQSSLEEPLVKLTPAELKAYKAAAGDYLEQTNYMGDKALDFLAGDLYVKQNMKKANAFLKGLSPEQKASVEERVANLRGYERKGKIAVERMNKRQAIELARQQENPELIAKREKELRDFEEKYKNAKLEREDLLGGATPRLISAVQNGNTRGALEEIVNDKTGAYNELEKLVAKRLLQVTRTLPKIEVVDPEVLEGADGQYVPRTDTVQIARGQVDSHTVLHELVHGYLHGYITDFESGDIQIAKGLSDLKAVYDHVMEKAPQLANKYGMKNLTEFASEVMSNREFQNELKGIKYKRGNIFTEFARAVMRILGLNPNQEMDALAAAMIAADRSLATGRQYQETKITEKQVRPPVQVKRELTAEGEEAQRYVDRMRGISNEKDKRPQMGTMQKLGAFFTDADYRQNRIDAFRTKVAYRGASVERKLQDAYNGAIRNALGEVRPDLFMTAAEHSDTLTVAAMKRGKLVLDDQIGWKAEEGTASMAGVFDVIHDLGRKLGDQDLAYKLANDAFIARRANALKGKGIVPADLLPDQAKIDAGLEAFKKFPELEQAFKQFTDFKNGLIDSMVQGGRLSKEDAQSWKDAADYVPWNRIKEYEENIQSSPKGFFKGLTNLGQMKKIKGSKEDEINNIFDNMVGLSFWMTNSAIRNHAALKLTDAFLKNNLGVRQVRPDQPGVNPNNVVFVYRDGKPEAYEFDDPLDVYAFKGVESVGGPLLDALTKASNVLRKTTTATPQFALSQMFQDSYRGVALSGVNTPFKVPFNVMRNFVGAFRGDSLNEQLENFGIVGAYDLMPGRAKDAIEKEFGIKQRSITDKILGTLEKPSLASDAALRRAVFQQTLEETKSAEFPEGDLLLARYRAQEIINFKRQGSDRNVAILRQIIPFMNAYIQGMDVLYRTMTGRGIAAEEKRVALRMFLSAGVKLTALSTMYAMLVAGDDEYEGLADYDKDKHFIIPGTGLKVPVAPEIGFMFKVIPERLYTYIVSQGTERPQDAKNMFKGMGTALFDAFTGPNLTPQLVKPTLEVMTNYSFFRNAPIVGIGMARQEPAMQFTDSTSELAKFLGGLANISPMKIDHILRGYTGIAGGTVLDLSTAAFGSGPDKRMYELPGFKTFMYDKVPSGYKQDFYQFRDESRRVVDTVNALKAKGQYDEIAEYLKDPEKMGMFMFKGFMNKMEQELEDIRAMKKLISGDKNMPSDARKDMLERIEMVENDLIRTINVPAMRRMAREFGQ